MDGLPIGQPAPHCAPRPRCRPAVLPLPPLARSRWMSRPASRSWLRVAFSRLLLASAPASDDWDPLMIGSYLSCGLPFRCQPCLPSAPVIGCKNATRSRRHVGRQKSAQMPQRSSSLLLTQQLALEGTRRLDRRCRLQAAAAAAPPLTQALPAQPHPGHRARHARRPQRVPTPLPPMLHGPQAASPRALQQHGQLPHALQQLRPRQQLQPPMPLLLRPVCQPCPGLGRGRLAMGGREGERLALPAWLANPPLRCLLPFGADAFADSALSQPDASCASGQYWRSTRWSHSATRCSPCAA